MTNLISPTYLSMHWNEKVDLIKKKYSDTEFFVPHVARKKILRSIESRFIQRPPDYYDLNNSNERFCNWWANIKSTHEYSVPLESDPILQISRLINPDETVWFAGEISGTIMIYRAKKNAILDLIASGSSWTETFHVIQLKYTYLTSFRIEDSRISIKVNHKHV